jgi:hypothetical protein
MDTAQERKFRRFKLEYVVHVRFPSGNAMAEVDAVTRNISLGGLLLDAPCLIPHRSQVEFTITVRGGSISRPVKLTGTGEVVRVEPGEMADEFWIAVGCSQPITQMDDLTAWALRPGPTVGE